MIKTQEENGRRKKQGKESPSIGVKHPRKDSKLPPNENLKKLPDEVYGDTTIPDLERKRSS